MGYSSLIKEVFSEDIYFSTFVSETNKKRTEKKQFLATCIFRI